MKEEWRSVKGYEGLYEVSNMGRVKSLYYGKERILRGTDAFDGYKIVSLTKQTIKKTGSSTCCRSLYTQPYEFTSSKSFRRGQT